MSSKNLAESLLADDPFAELIEAFVNEDKYTQPTASSVQTNAKPDAIPDAKENVLNSQSNVHQPKEIETVKKVEKTIIPIQSQSTGGAIVIEKSQSVVVPV